MIHQQYQNTQDQAREIVFLMPLDIDLKLAQLDVDFIMPDGTVRSITSKVTERGKEEEIYEDKIASTKSALAETLPDQSTEPCFKRY